MISNSRSETIIKDWGTKKKIKIKNQMHFFFFFEEGI